MTGRMFGRDVPEKCWRKPFAIKRANSSIFPAFIRFISINSKARSWALRRTAVWLGEDVSENQSPVYGCDVKGATALLCSAAKLPQNRCGAGG